MEPDSYLDSEESASRGIPRGAARQLLAAMLRHPGLLTAGFLVIVAGTFAALVEPWLFGYAIDHAIRPKNWRRLVQLTGFFLLVVAARVSATIGQAYLFEVLGQAVTQDLRIAVFSRLQRLPLSIFDKKPAGWLMTRVTNDITAIADIFSAGFVMMVSNALLVLGIMISLLLLDLRLGLITLSVFPPLLFVTARFSRQLQIYYRDARSRLSALNAFLAENLAGMKVVHLFNRQRIHLDRFARLNQSYTDTQVSSIRTYAYLQPTITSAAGVSMALLIWFGGNPARDGTMPVGALVTYFMYTLALFKPLRDIADKWNIFLSGLAAAEKIFSVLEWPTELAEEAIDGPALAYSLRGEVRFEDVWFAYESDRWVLRNFSFTIPSGTRVGIVGPTGSGKTTLINLLMRFYEPQKGRILLDGKDLREYDKRRLRASFGLVQQDVFLFSGSVEDNVTLFSSTPGTAVLDKFGFTDGKLLSERGGNVSAGERQLVAFARAYAAEPRIWILDEATSNMDSGSELTLHHALVGASREKTLILIAHRLATTRSCDTVIVLKKGQIVETGNHRELMGSNGLYARLYRFQEASDAGGKGI